MALGWTGPAHLPTGPKAIDHGGLWFHLTYRRTRTAKHHAGSQSVNDHAGRPSGVLRTVAGSR